ncbi:DUF397 domain-containing protein [Nocardia sp. NPDC050697]|uniref:DUF397 domain-containing protein n=1 Tax=Nocardia sp. NPDC050697 TaxID=3155158 RepID=UPI0033EE9B39
MSEPRWFKSSYSGDGGNCVEVAYLPSGETGVRDSKNPGAGHLSFPATAWSAFVAGLK